MINTKYLITLLLALFVKVCYSQDGANDTLFNVFDNGLYGDGTGANDLVRTVTPQLDGKILVGGDFINYSGVLKNRIIRLNQNGSIDTTFHTGTGFNGSVRCITVQNDGKIIIGGTFTEYNGASFNRIIRLNTDGSVDNSFVIGTGFSSSFVNSIVVKSDGKIIVVGLFLSYNGNNSNGIVQLNSNGTLDSSFLTGTGFQYPVYAVCIQTDGKLIVGGDFLSYNGFGVNRLVRLNANGTIDLTFNPGSGFNNVVYTAIIQPDGKILAGGDFTGFNGTSRNKIARINTNGSVDLTFNLGTGFNGSVHSFSLAIDGAITVGGDFSTYAGFNCNYIVKLNSNGTIDNSFSQIATGFSDYVTSVTNSVDNKIIIGGNFLNYGGNYRGRIIKLESSGTIDTSFHYRSGFDEFVFTSCIQSDGKILVGGDFNIFHETEINRIARLNSDGTLDTTFNVGTGFDDQVTEIELQTSGKILVAGYFTSYNSVAVNGLVRLNEDGTIDNSFNIGSGPDEVPLNITNPLLIQSDGKIIVCGGFNSFNGIARNGIVRLNEDGSVDLTFELMDSYDGSVGAMAIQNDGKIIIGGTFTTVNGISRNRIARLNSNGSIDLTFNPGTGFNGTPRFGVIQNDQKIILTGDFTQYNGFVKANIVRINSNGDIDQQYNPLGVNSVLAIKIQPDWKLLLGGAFSWFNGTSSQNLTRLNIDGSNDTTFNMSNGFNAPVYTISIQGEDNIVVGGAFTNYKGYVRNKIAQLLVNDCHFDSSIVVSSCTPYFWATDNQFYTMSGYYTYLAEDAFGCDSIFLLDLTIIDNYLDSNSIFSLPSSEINCNGQLAITSSGNPDFELSLDGNQSFTSSGYAFQTGLCPGIHDLQSIDYCGDTVHQVVVIPVDSNYVFNNPFIDSIAVDSLGNTISNCNIYYNSIDTAYIDSIWGISNQVNVIWNIIDSNGSSFDTTSFELNNGFGIYWLQLSVFCPNRATGDYFTVTQAIYFGNSGPQLVGIDEIFIEERIIELYPNPTRDEITISYSSDSQASVKLIDAQGKLVQQHRLLTGDKFSMMNLENGIYFIQINLDGNTFTEKVIKQ